MIVFGVGASTCGAKCEDFAFRRNTEVTDTTVPAGTRTGAAERRRPDLGIGLGRLFCVPHSKLVPSVQMQCRMIGDLASHCNLGLLGADSLHQPDAPRFQCRPALGSVQQDACGLEQVGPQQPVAPFRDSTVEVQLARLLPPWC